MSQALPEHIIISRVLLTRLVESIAYQSKLEQQIQPTKDRWNKVINAAYLEGAKLLGGNTSEESEYKIMPQETDFHSDPGDVNPTRGTIAKAMKYATKGNTHDTFL